jgi:hypothetical protein
MAGYWLKLYTEILDDPKYYRLSDNAKLGMYELMLVAKKVGQDGHLPGVDDIEFYTRRSASWWEPVIDELKAINFITGNEAGHVIRKFEDRQKAVTDTEKQRYYREALHKKEFTGDVPVTEVLRNVTESKSKRKIKSTEVEKEIEENNAPSPVQRLLESLTGIPPANAADVDAIREIEMMNPTEQDIRAAIAWVQTRGVKRIKRYTSLVNPISVCMANRLNKPKTTLDKSKEAILKAMAEMKNEEVSSGIF